MKNILLIFCTLASYTFSDPAAAEVILKTDQSWDGNGIQYPSGEAEITSVLLKLEADKPTPWHCHPVPTTGYVLSGQIEVETANGQKTLISEGESAVEVMNTLHRGTAVGDAVKLVVFYVGTKGLPNTLLPDTENPDPCVEINSAE